MLGYRIVSLGVSMKVRCCALIVKDKRILTLKYLYPNSDVYALPGGGQQDGETMRAALIREVAEELSVDIEPTGILLVGDSPASKFLPQTVHVVFTARILSGDPAIASQHTKANACVWLDANHITKTMLYPAINAHIADYLDHQESPGYVENCMNRPWA